MRTTNVIVPLSMLLATTACTASLELERFKKQEAQVGVDATSITYFDFKMSCVNMQSHIDETMEIRLVDKSNAIQGKGVYVDIPKPDFTLSFPKLIPKANGPYRIDYWADHNKSGKYDGIVGGINDKDHAWRRVLSDPLPEDVRLVEGRYELTFLHDTAFVDINTDLDGNPISGEDTLLPFALTVSGAGAYAGKTIEIRVVDKGSGRLVALHRRGRAPESYVAEVKGVLDEETPYEISAYVDANDDEQWSPDDPSWKIELLSSEAGVVGTLDLATAAQTPLGDAR